MRLQTGMRACAPWRRPAARPRPCKVAPRAPGPTPGTGVPTRIPAVLHVCAPRQGHASSFVSACGLPGQVAPLAVPPSRRREAGPCAPAQGARRRRWASWPAGGRRLTGRAPPRCARCSRAQSARTAARPRRCGAPPRDTRPAPPTSSPCVRCARALLRLLQTGRRAWRCGGRLVARAALRSGVTHCADGQARMSSAACGVPLVRDPGAPQLRHWGGRDGAQQRRAGSRRARLALPAGRAGRRRRRCLRRAAGGRARGRRGRCGGRAVRGRRRGPGRRAGRAGGRAGGGRGRGGGRPAAAGRLRAADPRYAAGAPTRLRRCGLLPAA